METLELDFPKKRQMILARQQLRVLFIGDEIDTSHPIDGKGNTTLALTRVSPIAGELEFIQPTNFDLILIDSRLSERECRRAFTRARQQNPTLPILVLPRDTEGNFETGESDRDRLLRSIIRSIECQRENEELQREIARERQMGAIVERVTSSLDPRHILDTTVSEVRQFLDVDRVSIYRMQDGESGRVVAHARENGDDEVYCPDTIGLIEPFLSTFDCHRARENPRSLYPISRQLLNSIVNVPIWQTRIDRETRLWGWLIVRDTTGTRQWQGWEVSFLARLADRVASAIARSELYQSVEKQAAADGLTGIANRRQFDRRLGEEWRKHATHRHPLSLILCDVDYFKKYNDRYGHLAGDECLKRVAAAIARSYQRATDLACRYGGEEFAVILPRTNADGAYKVARAIERNLQRSHLVHEASEVSDRITVSIGIASEIPDPSRLPDSLIDRADRALRTAKKDGKNCIRAKFP